MRFPASFFSPVAQEDGLLFINLFPSTIIADAFPLFVNDLRRRLLSFVHRIVLEINESITEEPIWSNPVFMQRIKDLRNNGFLIALDDVGEGTTTFRKIFEISPDFIKIDQFFFQRAIPLQEETKGSPALCRLLRGR